MRLSRSIETLYCAFSALVLADSPLGSPVAFSTLTCVLPTLARPSPRRTLPRCLVSMLSILGSTRPVVFSTLPAGVGESLLTGSSHAKRSKARGVQASERGCGPWRWFNRLFKQADFKCPSVCFRMVLIEPETLSIDDGGEGRCLRM